MKRGAVDPSATTPPIKGAGSMVCMFGAGESPTRVPTLGTFSQSFRLKGVGVATRSKSAAGVCSECSGHPYD